MKEDSRLVIFSPNKEVTELKPWQTPAFEEMDVDQTEEGFVDPSSDIDLHFS